MATLTALLSLAVLSQAPVSRPEDAPSFTTTLAGMEVKFDLVPDEARGLTADILTWDGWKFGPGGEAAEVGDSKPLRIRTLPADAEARYRAVKTKHTPDTPVWRHKFFVLTNSERGWSGSGLWGYRREEIPDEEIPAILKEIARFGALLDIALDGEARTQIDVEIDPHPLYKNSDQPAEAVAQWMEEYVRTRVNGPGFEPDDRVYRGPYDSVTLIRPLDTLAATHLLQVNQTPVWSTTWPGVMSNTNAASLAIDWFLKGLKAPAAWGLPEHNGGAGEPLTRIAAILAGGDEPTAEEVSTLAGHVVDVPEATTAAPNASVYGNVNLTLEQDSERGTVLKYQELGVARNGMFVLPRASYEAGDVLKFWAKTSSPDVVTVFLGDDYSLSTTLTDVQFGSTNAALLPNDGQWHEVSVHIPARGPSNAAPDWIGIGASAEASKIATAAVEVLFDDFQIIRDASVEGLPEVPKPAASLDSTRAIEIALGLAQIADPDDQEKLDRAVKLLDHPSDIVRMTAAGVFTRVTYPNAEQALTTRSMDPNVFVGSAALRALAHQGTKTAVDAIRRNIDIAPDDARRGVAALLLAELTKDPRVAGPISTSIIRRSRDAKLDSIRALAMLPGEQPALVLTAFLAQEDPWIRLTAVEHADIQYPSVRRQILYSAVNDPSDAVRIASYKKLLGSSDEATRLEGAKGVRDEGLLTRLAVVEALASNPAEEFRTALRMAVVDPSAQVRAAAIRALAKLPKGVEAEEIANTLQDPHPWVQLALLDIAENAGFRLDEATVKLMEASTFPGIAPRAAKLPR